METSEQGIVGIVCVQQPLFNINVCRAMQCDIVPCAEWIEMIDSVGMWLYRGTVKGRSHYNKNYNNNHNYNYVWTVKISLCLI